VTVSNPRVGQPIADTESLFVPFKGQFEDASAAVAGAPLLPAAASNSSLGGGVGKGNLCVNFEYAIVVALAVLSGCRELAAHQGHPRPRESLPCTVA
jgi:hypothetical protein